MLASSSALCYNLDTDKVYPQADIIRLGFAQGLYPLGYSNHDW